MAKPEILCAAAAGEELSRLHTSKCIKNANGFVFLCAAAVGMTAGHEPPLATRVVGRPAHGYSRPRDRAGWGHKDRARDRALVLDIVA